jgi:hypothetical protein
VKRNRGQSWFMLSRHPDISRLTCM